MILIHIISQQVLRSSIIHRYLVYFYNYYLPFSICKSVPFVCFPCSYSLVVPKYEKNLFAERWVTENLRHSLLDCKQVYKPGILENLDWPDLAPLAWLQSWPGNKCGLYKNCCIKFIFISLYMFDDVIDFIDLFSMDIKHAPWWLECLIVIIYGN